jgi:hypothetical protein
MKTKVYRTQEWMNTIDNASEETQSNRGKKLNKKEMKRLKVFERKR